MLNLTILQDNVPEYINLLVFLNCLEKDNSDYVGTAHAILCYMILLDGSVIVISQVRHEDGSKWATETTAIFQEG